MIGVRKMLDKVFLKSELKILDDILPHFTRHERLDDEVSFVITVEFLYMNYFKAANMFLYLTKAPKNEK